MHHDFVLQLCFTSLSPFLKSEQSIRTVQNNYYNKICLDGPGSPENWDFVSIKKNSKQILKNVKFVLQAYFIVIIILSGSDRLFGF